MRYLLKIITLLLFVPLTIQSQDIHFAHIHASPVVLNPAMVGVIGGGDIRFISNARMQWSSFTKGYKTLAASVDYKTAYLGKNAILGTGLQLYTDQAGDLNFTTNSAALSTSVMQTLGKKTLVSFGIQAGFVSNRVDFQNMIGFDPEPLINDGVPDRITYWDLNAGASYNYQISRYSHFYAGAAMFHLNRPWTSFFGRSANAENYNIEGLDDVLYERFVIHAGGEFRMSKYLSLMPTALFMDQGVHREITVGSFVHYESKMSNRKRSQRHFYIGGWVRAYAEQDIAGIDAVITSIRVDHGNTKFTFSFDFNISTLRRASWGLGGPELSIIHVVQTNREQKKRSKVICPAF